MILSSTTMFADIVILWFFEDFVLLLNNLFMRFMSIFISKCEKGKNPSEAELDPQIRRVHSADNLPFLRQLPDLLHQVSKDSLSVRNK